MVPASVSLLLVSLSMVSYMYVPIIYAAAAAKLLPCPGYYKQCCDEHWDTPVSFNSGFLSVYAQQWDCWIIRQLYFQFFKESPHCSP